MIDCTKAAAGMLRRGLLPLLLAAALGACGAGERGVPVRVEIGHTFGAQPLQLDNAAYRTAAGDEVTLRRLRYYLSNFRLRRADGSWFAAARDERSDAGYQLVDEAKGTTKTFDIAGVAPGQYAGIEFLLGVDDARNRAGAQAGALDPARGMFWTWHTGYIFLMLEGRSPQSTAAAQAVTFHVGGSEAPALSRTVFLPFPKPLRVEPALLATVHLQADIAAVFDGPKPLRLAERNSVMDRDGGQVIADNAAGMFRVDHLHHEPRAAAAR